MPGSWPIRARPSFAGAPALGAGTSTLSVLRPALSVPFGAVCVALAAGALVGCLATWAFARGQPQSKEKPQAASEKRCIIKNAPMPTMDAWW